MEVSPLNLSPIKSSSFVKKFCLLELYKTLPLSKSILYQYVSWTSSKFAFPPDELSGLHSNPLASDQALVANSRLRSKSSFFI